MNFSLLSVLEKHYRSFIFWVTYFLFYFIICFFVIVSFESFYDFSPPMLVLSEQKKIERRGEIIEVNCIKHYTVIRKFGGDITKIFTHKLTGQSHEVYTSFNYYKEGSFDVVSYSILPGDLPDGTYSVKTKIVWRPDLSFKEHVAYSFDDDIFICGKTEKCINK